MDINDGGLFQLGGEKVLLLAIEVGAEPLDLDGRQHFAGGQGLIEQWRGFVKRAGEGQRFMHALSGGLAALRVGWGTDLMVDFLGEDFVFVTFHKDVAHRFSGERAFGDMPLIFAVDADVRGCWHDKLLVAMIERPRGRGLWPAAMALQALDMSALKFDYRCSTRSSDTSTCWVMVFRRIE